MATRKILAVIIALTLVLGSVICLSGCSEDTKEFTLTESETGGLMPISRQYGFIEDYNYIQYILYDPDTLVMYSLISNPDGITVTALYNADGTPKLYNPEN